MVWSGKRVASVLVGALLAALAFAAVAQANVYCVNEPACVGAKEPSTGAGVQEALLEAGKHVHAAETPDEVVIGPGEYSLETGFEYKSPETVIVRGAGAGSTVLTRPAASGADVLLLQSAGSTVEDVTIRAPAHAALPGAALEGGTLERDTIEAPLGVGVKVTGEGTLGADVISGSAPLVSRHAYELILEDSLVEMGGAETIGAEIVADSSGFTEAFFRQDAIVGGGHTGLVLRGEGQAAVAILENSIISEAGVPIQVEATGEGNKATLTSEYSSFDKEQDVETPDVAVVNDLYPVPGPPSFVSPLTGDFRLAPGSPLIDAGSPGLELKSGELKTDLAGNPRIVHGARDVGPYEYQWRPPVVGASANATTAAKGEVLTFTGSASAVEPGDTIANYQWTFDDGAAVHAGASASHAFSTPGPHTATLTATDAQGVVGSATVAVDVLSESCSASGCGTAACHTSPCGPEVVHILHLALSPHSLRAARSGGSVGRGHAGVRVSYTLSGRVHKVIFTVVRKRTGVKVGKRCLPARKGRHGHGCALRVTVPGLFEQTAKGGSNSFRFTGRIGGRTLAPGSYELIAAIKGSAGSAAEAPFTVVG